MIQGFLIDLHEKRIFPAQILVENGKIAAIERLTTLPEDTGFLLPGFVDAHVHIESSMLPPSEFARMAVVHGTVATVSDPHEIANVLGMEGVQFMLDDAAKSPLKFCFGAPSCVPATEFETSGATLSVQDVEQLLDDPRIGYLSEMMNFPGVLNEDPEVMAKIEAAQARNKPVDGHAPGLRGEQATAYFKAGITTDHECFTYDEGFEKAEMGVKILIREGSAARNFEELWPLIEDFPDQVMFCSDDKHPDDLAEGHINALVRRAVRAGCDLFDTLRAACIHPVEHYRLPVGTLRVGDPADFILVNNLEEFEVQSTWIDGVLVAEQGISLIKQIPIALPNHFIAAPIQPTDFMIPVPLDRKAASLVDVRAIGAMNGQIVTKHLDLTVKSSGKYLMPDLLKDVLFISVINRYSPKAYPAMGFVKGFGLVKGAIASSVAHDSHNIVAVGHSADALAAVVNQLIAQKGGIAATDGHGAFMTLPLPIAGLMSDMNGYALADAYRKIDHWVKTELGSTLSAPFMTLSFLALPVIPSLKITDIGLFDVEKFDFTDVII